LDVEGNFVMSRWGETWNADGVFVGKVLSGFINIGAWVGFRVKVGTSDCDFNVNLVEFFMITNFSFNGDSVRGSL